MLETEKEKSMTRKEYLKYKKKKNRSLPWLKNIALLLVIVALSLYVVNQLKVYTSVTEIANKMLEESKLIKKVLTANLPVATYKTEDFYNDWVFI